MRDLPRLPEGASADEKIRILYDWLYELQMEISSISTQNDSEKSLSQEDGSAVQMAAEGVMADADVTSGEE